MVIENSLGELEDASWHERAAELLKQSLKERGQWEAVKVWQKYDIILNSIRALDQTAVLLRTLGFSEQKMGVYHLHDHIPSILKLVSE